MRTGLLFLLSWLLLPAGYGQSLEPSVIANAGKHYTGTTTQLSWTLGETFVQTLETDQTILTQGFHQPQIQLTAVEEIEELKVRLSPNPTAHFVEIFTQQETENLHIQLTDAAGRILLPFQDQPTANPFRLDLSAHPAGIYFLQLSDKNLRRISTYKIAKN